MTGSDYDARDNAAKSYELAIATLRAEFEAAQRAKQIDLFEAQKAEQLDMPKEAL